MKQKYLVTGGAGFIGARVCEELAKQGHTIRIIDNHSDILYSSEIKEKRKELLKSTYPKLIFPSKLDLCENYLINDVMYNFQPDVIIHLAADAGVQPSKEDPVEYVRANVLGTTTLFQAAVANGVHNIVWASSSSVYGPRSDGPFKETDDVHNKQISPYASSKYMCETLADLYHRMHPQLHLAGLRFFTVYGEESRPDMLLAKCINWFMNNEPIPIRGERGANKRDWTYVGDVVNGVLAVANNISQVGCEIYNIGNGNPQTVDDFVDLVQSELESQGVVSNSEINREEIPQGDVPLTWADTSKLEALTGWKATTSLEEGIRKAITHHLSQTQKTI